MTCVVHLYLFHFAHEKIVKSGTDHNNCAQLTDLFPTMSDCRRFRAMNPFSIRWCSVTEVIAAITAQSRIAVRPTRDAMDRRTEMRKISEFMGIKLEPFSDSCRQMSRSKRLKILGSKDSIQSTIRRVRQYFRDSRQNIQALYSRRCNIAH